MSLATRCPGCDTVFRVTTQEATARGGTVRCGVCGTVFNALDALVLAEALPTPAEQNIAAHGADETPGEAFVETFNQGAPGSDDEDAQKSAVEDDLVITMDETEPATTVDALNDVLDDAAVIAANETLADEPEPEHEPEPPAEADVVFDVGANEAVYDGSFRETQPAPSSTTADNASVNATADALGINIAADTAVSAALITDNPASDPLLAPPRFSGFDPDSGSRMTRGIAALIVVAVLALGAQAVYVWRDALAAAWPASKPALQQACTLLGCRVQVPTGLEHLSIESSELQAVPDTKESYTFNALLRSRSPTALRFPAIELTLTDALNQVIARRILTPEQYLNPTQRKQFGDGIAPNAELPIKIAFDVPGTAVVGYRVGLLYP